MRRGLALLVLLGACSSPPNAGTAATTSPTVTTTTTTLGTTTVTGPAGTATTAPTTTTMVPRVRPEGEDAPDFALALGEGGTFVLSEEHRPVFLLFWAEW